MTRTPHLFFFGALFIACCTLTSCSRKDNNTSTGADDTSCERGTQGCACEASSICGTDADGVQLACITGICEPAPCEAGSAGCVCDAGTCDEGLECSSASGVERCEVSACEVGSEGCGCQLDRKCDNGLNCVQGYCAQLTCTPGSLGCNCSVRYTCESNLVCDLGSEVCREAGSCTPGNLGCECDANNSCVGDLVCGTEGTCEDTTCTPGLEGCSCLNDSCGKTTSGEPLECMAGVCQQSTCPVGERGCACGPNNTCNDELDSCENGYCLSSECIPGEVGCECLAGGCDPGAKCVDDTVCVDQTGKNGGPCLDNGTCSRNNRCDSSVVPSVCVTCELGSIGCQCQDDDSCNPGLLCLMGHCVGDETVQDRTPNTDASCYTPCEDNLITEDESRRCVNGFIEGCLEGMECTLGSCVKADTEPDMCFSDSDCPSFQLCMQGYCYVECEGPSDCTDGSYCQDKVCRESCSMNSNDCPSGYVCESDDGDSGYCMIKSAETNQVRVQKTGSLAVSTNVLEFTNTHTSRTFILQNLSDDYVNFTLSKAEHSVLFSDPSSGSERISNYEGTDCSGAQCPLRFVEMGEFGRISGDQEVTLRVPPRCDEDCPQITVRLAGSGVNAIRWQGVIEILSDVGSERVNLSYVSSPEGRWSGTMVYFANFEDRGIDTEGGIIGWLDRTNKDNVAGVENGLIQKWGGFRTGALTDGWNEMKAVLTSTQTGQWDWPSVRDACFINDGACFLYATGAGASPRSYVQSTSATPIPTGVTEFPMAMNLRIPDGNTPTMFNGRVVTDKALHYAGDPAIELGFARDPADIANCDTSISTNCVMFLDEMDLNLNVGARYPLIDTTSSCISGFEKTEFPWLVEGFLKDAYQDAGTGLYRKAHCNDVRVPYENPNGDPEIQAMNLNLAKSNPIPNGRVLSRQIELLDGAMIDQSEMIIFFRERYPSFIDDEPVTAYGYIVLEREPLEIDEDDEDANGIPDEYEGSTVPSAQSDASVGSHITCSRDILDPVLGTNVGLSQTNAHQVIAAIIRGGNPVESSRIKYLYETGSNNEEVHYFCEDTGLFDGGSDNIENWGEGYYGENTDDCGTALNGVCEDGGSNATASTCNPGEDVTDCGMRYTDTRVACPRKSNIIFFTTDATLLPDIHTLACQQDGTCLDQLNSWRTSGNPILKQIDVKWTCEGDVVFCDENELDRRDGKLFYKKGSSDLPFLPIHAEIEEAFRYKTRFKSRDGLSSVGFEPSLCEPFSNTTPYCYDADQIESIAERTSCLLHIYDSYYDSAQGGLLSEADALYDYLEESFSYREEPSVTGGLPTTYDGFERLYAELVIMLGDAAYTSAFESRFNLAGSLAASFEGSKFESDGIDLSGIAGYEMFKLYQAVQYYEMVLNRFYEMGNVIGAAMDSGSPQTASNFISSGTVTAYFDRLIRASTQRSRAMSEIVRRYQSLNRPDLARRVAERAYTSTYLESMFLSNLIVRFYAISGGSQKPQILIELEKSQLRYRTALVDLTQVYNAITTDVNFFGYPADYIPFPTLDNTSNTTAESNAFEKILRTATSKLEVARTREQNALSQTRTYETDEASFQAELTRITRTYENQLGDICGTFQGSDGLIHPVIERYAYLDERLSIIGDPCGFGTNGGIYRAMGELNLAQLELRRISIQAQNILETIDIEKKRVEDQCDTMLDLADYKYKIGEKLFDLEEDAIKRKEDIEFWTRKADTVAKGIEITQCAGEECIATPIALGLLLSTASATEYQILKSQEIQREKREERNQIEIDAAQWEMEVQCDLAIINSNAQTATQMLALRDLQISGLAAEYRVNLAVSEVQKLRQQAKRLELEWQETLDTTVNVESAKNDPNIRIYRNDSVINAEISFDDAMREAYRLTRVYEYYTSTSYIDKDQLFLIRMVSSGDYNLENYIYDLKNSFDRFEEEYGIPELRVQVVSLRDDIFDIPTLGDNGEALSINERSALLRDRLSDPGLLNSDGFLAIPFTSNLEDLSPLTRNHKIFYIEANIEGNDNGDFLGRVYLRLVGTSIIKSLDDELAYYRFPTRTAVINPFFNGTRQFSQSNELYRSYRLREFPLVNTDWEMVLNQRNEKVNQDINLDELIDIKLYIFYTDFTQY